MIAKSKGWIVCVVVALALALVYEACSLLSTGTTLGWALSGGSTNAAANFASHKEPENEKPEHEKPAHEKPHQNPAHEKPVHEKPAHEKPEHEKTEHGWTLNFPKPNTTAAGTPPHTPKLAIATFFTGQSSDDTYYNLVRLFVYQLLHVPDTRITNPDLGVVVFCGQRVSRARKAQLAELGAIIITIEDVPVPPWISTSESRWSEQFTKLRIFEVTLFERILYIDADYMFMHPMDEIFEDPIVKHKTPTIFSRKSEIKEDEGPLPESWILAGRPDNGGQGSFDHFVPPYQTNYMNAGFILIAPDDAMYNHLMTVKQIEGRYSTHFMEQDLLNYVFRRDGPMPWREVNWKWSANFVNEKDVEFGIHSLHGKFYKEGPQVVRDRWQKLMHDMEEMSGGHK